MPAFCDGLHPPRLSSASAPPSLFGSAPRPAALLGRRAARSRRGTKDVSLIFLFLHGGLSTIDTFDLKPDAPAEFRGEFNPIDDERARHRRSASTAAEAGAGRWTSSRWSARSATTTRDHGPADHYMLTGYFPQAGLQPEPDAEQPAAGASARSSPASSGRAARCRRTSACRRCTPAAARRTSARPHAPFVIDADPNAPNFAVPDLVPPPALAADRLDDRRELLDAASTASSKAAEAKANRARRRRRRRSSDKAFDLMTSPAAKKAFDIHAEPDKLRDEYGRHTLGQSCLMARRLVEAGVRCVTIDHSNWDTHDDNFATLKNDAAAGARRGDRRRCSATWPTAACSTRRWWSSPASSAARRGSTRTPAATTGARRSRWRSAAAASRAAASSARPTPAPSGPPSDPLRPGRPGRDDVPPAGHRPEGRVPHARRPAGGDRQQRPGDRRVAVSGRFTTEAQRAQRRDSQEIDA